MTEANAHGWSAFVSLDRFDPAACRLRGTVHPPDSLQIERNGALPKMMMAMMMMMMRMMMMMMMTMMIMMMMSVCERLFCSSVVD